MGARDDSEFLRREDEVRITTPFSSSFPDGVGGSRSRTGSCLGLHGVEYGSLMVV